MKSLTYLNHLLIFHPSHFIIFFVNLRFSATDDGVIRIYKGYDEYDKPEAGLVTAWRALKGMEKSSNKQSGLVCDWYQNRGTLLIGGDARVIKVWDAQQELVLTVSV
jgi:regulator-associated protein of mTOR